jgi:hypothetical protein
MTTGRIGRRTPAFFIHQAPCAWRKSIKYWAALVLGLVLGAIAAGALVIVLDLVQ